MTREEIIEHLDSIVGTYTILLGHGVNSDVLDTDDIEAINESIRIIKAIEDIKAEIDEQYDRVHPYDISCAEGLEMALNIVDKYIAEEGKA